MTYGLTIIFFSYMLEKQLSTVFYPRLLANIFLGIIVTHLFRKALLAFSLHPPMPTFKWGQLLILLLTFASAYSFLTSYAVEILTLIHRLFLFGYPFIFYGIILSSPIPKPFKK